MKASGTSPDSNADVFTRCVGWLDRLRYPTFLIVASLIAFVVLIYFFSPRIVIWKGLDLGTPISYSNPEVNRALFTLKKIEQPFQFFEYPPTQNADANWRLLFPLVGHYLHLPRLMFMALPHLGCLLVLAFITHLVCRNTGDRLMALGTALLMGASSWFFVSIGWLTYFDSWYVLGLLAVAFAPSRLALVAACFLTPWVDERFIVTLPVAMVVRGVFFYRFSERPWMANWRDVLVIAGSALPWVAFRVFILLYGTDPYPVTHHLKTYNFLRTIHFGQLIESHWAGIRAAWVFVLIFFWYAFPEGKRGWSALVLGVILAVELPLMALSGDWSRDMSTLLPVAILGVMLMARFHAKWSKDCLYLALAFNLFAPAIHGFDVWRLPINNLYAEIEHYKNPPEYLNPLAYNQAAIQLVQQGDLTNALTNLDCALRLDGEIPDVLLNRAIVRQRLGDGAGARMDVAKALSVAPGDWPQRMQAEQVLAGMRFSQ